MSENFVVRVTAQTVCSTRTVTATITGAGEKEAVTVDVFRTADRDDLLGSIIGSTGEGGSHIAAFELSGQGFAAGLTAVYIAVLCGDQSRFGRVLFGESVVLK